jgi:pimeloyl-ACP methyl ester carboxylesterase
LHPPAGTGKVRNDFPASDEPCSRSVTLGVETAALKRDRSPYRPVLVLVGGVAIALCLGLAWLTHQEKLDPDAFLEAVGWAGKPESTLIFPVSGAGVQALPRSAADLRTGLANMLRSDRFSTSALLIPGGQKADAIPVVFVHGLMSTPDMWSGVVRYLRRDPGIAARYQFWFFYYPTGQPIPLSALQFRETLDEAAGQGRIRRPLVLVGHSMGGIVARAQAASLTPERAEAMLPGISSYPPEQLVKRSLIFPARTDVARIVFIATPHRGTEFAYRGISRLGHYLIRLPRWIHDEILLFQDAIPQLGGRRYPTSIAGLSPSSAFLRGLDEAPLGAPVHSILPVLGDPGDPLANDGVVPLWSSRVPFAVSELLVPGDHGAFDAPESLSELRRILRLHAGMPALQ